MDETSGEWMRTAIGSQIPVRFREEEAADQGEVDPEKDIFGEKLVRKNLQRFYGPNGKIWKGNWKIRLDKLCLDNS